MNYDLALRLKNAGFPQENPRELWCIPCAKWRDTVCFSKLHEREAIKIPTLSELIEACGDEFRNLTQEYGRWHTNFIQGHDYDYGETEGSTPEEAVANLYLALHEKV